MTQTNYVNPNGLPADGQITSARDLAILARAIIRDLPEYEYFMHIPAIRFGRRVTQQFQQADRPLSRRRRHEDRLHLRLRLQSGGLRHPQRQAADRGRARRLLGPVRAVRAAQLLERGFAGNGLSWLQPSLGTVDSLAPIDAEPPNLRDDMCGGKRKRPASDEDDDVVAAGGSASSRRDRGDVLHRGPAGADAEAVRDAGRGGRGRRADGGLYRPDQARRGADRGGRGGRRQADARRARQESRVAAKKPDCRGAEGRSRREARQAAKPAGEPRTPSRRRQPCRPPQPNSAAAKPAEKPRRSRAARRSRPSQGRRQAQAAKPSRPVDWPPAPRN